MAETSAPPGFAASVPASAPASTSSGRGGGGGGGRGRGGRNNNNPNNQQKNRRPQKEENEHQNNDDNNTQKRQELSAKSGRGGGGGRGGRNNNPKPPRAQNLDSFSATIPLANSASDAATSAKTGGGDEDAGGISTNTNDTKTKLNTHIEPGVAGENAPECLICCEKIVYFAVGECNHAEVCALCSIRMRKLYDDRDCCMCKKSLEKVYVTNNRDMMNKYEELDGLVASSPNVLQRYHLDGPANVYFMDKEYYTFATHLFDIACQVCGHEFSSMQSLRQHAEHVHGELYCDLCVKHRKVFIHEQIRYPSHGALARHVEKGDADLKLKPHPWCKYCEICFFSDEELYRHCEESHFKCFICERNNILFNYFRNYKHLEEHFDNKHFLCSDSECLEKKFVVFRTKFELQAHEVVHLSKRNLSRADQLAARTLQVNFTVRRSTRHGGGLDDSGSSSNNNANADASNSLAETEQYQALAQQSYQTRSTSQNRAAVSASGGGARARPVESPVFYPDDRRNRRPERETNYNAADTGFRLSSNTPTDAPKPLNSSSGSIPPANTSSSSSSSSSASNATTPTTLTPAERTKNLINKIKTFLGDDKFAEFRRISANFKQGKMTSQQYYQQFQHEFGESAEADKLFEEMVDLLPDSHKQRSLWDIHSKTRRMSADFPSLQNNGGGGGGGGGGGNASWVAAPAARAGRGGGSSAPQRTEAFPALPPASAPERSLPGHRAPPGHQQNNQPAWPAPPPSLQGQAKPTNKKGKKVLLSYG